jgi:hypothetical protein
MMKDTAETVRLVPTGQQFCMASMAVNWSLKQA